jgi:hypothetical protein
LDSVKKYKNYSFDLGLLVLTESIESLVIKVFQEHVNICSMKFEFNGSYFWGGGDVLVVVSDKSYNFKKQNYNYVL